MVFKSICALVLCTNVASALEGLIPVNSFLQQQNPFTRWHISHVKKVFFSHQSWPFWPHLNFISPWSRGRSADRGPGMFRGLFCLDLTMLYKQHVWKHDELDDPDRAPLKEVLGGQYNYREGGRQVLRQGAKGRRRNRKWQCSKDPCAQKVSGGRTDPSPKYRWKVHG